MGSKLTFNKSIAINAPVSKVWDALTDPVMIKQYMFGTDAVSDWKRGRSITYSGEWNGKAYKDSGTIVEIIPEKLLHTTYFSAMSGKEDKPENYANVVYEVSPENGGAVFTVSQDNIDNEEQLKHIKQSWSTMLDSFKKLLEHQ